MEEEEEAADLKLQLFHNTLREHIIFLLLFMLLYVASYTLISRFRRRDREDLYSNEEDEILVYRISSWLCTFSMAVALGAALLLPISIASNEVLLLYPHSYYVKWLNSSLIQGLWNQIFLFSNLSLFVFLPFAYLFTESSGFFGHKKGIIARAYETLTVFGLLAFVVLGLTYVLSALLEPGKISFLSILNPGSVHLPFLYSCISFLGVLLLLVCTPFGFIRMFGIVGKVLVKPHLMRDVNEEFIAYNLEEASLRRKLENIELQNISIVKPSRNFPKCLCSVVTKNDQSFCAVSPSTEHFNCMQRKTHRLVNDKRRDEQKHLNARLIELELGRQKLDKLRKSSSFQRNCVYPLALLLLLFYAGITILLVVQNSLELLIGIKALPLSTRKFTLGIMSLSKLGLFGAGLEVCLIFNLAVTSVVGFYSMPFMTRVRPQRQKTSLPQLIFNCALLLILSSALPVLNRIIGVLNGPDIRKLMKNKRFDDILIDVEKAAWFSIKEVVAGFLGNHRSQNFEKCIHNMLAAFEAIGVHMSLKIHYLHHHLEYFSNQLPSESDEQGERFHQTALPFELRYRGKGSPDAVMAEICWRSKNLFQETEDDHMEVEDGEGEIQSDIEDSFFELYRNSDDDDSITEAL